MYNIKNVRKQDFLYLVLAVVIFAVFQFAISERIISSFWRLNIILICINIILASSLNLIVGAGTCL